MSQVADALKMVCAALPAPLDVECEVMITVSNTENTQHCTLIISLQEYTDDIIELIVNQYMHPGDVCNAIGLCP